MIDDSTAYGPSTRAAHLGRDPHAFHGAVNPPVYHASTILFPTVAALEHAGRTTYEGVTYGRHGTPTTFAFERAVASLEGAFRSIAVSSGAAAVATSLLSFTHAGDHLLVTDNAYAPSRNVSNELLGRLGVTVEYFDPSIGAGIEAMLRPNTRAILLESPGSLTFEMCDVAAIAAIARARGIRTIVDNTWGTPLFFRPIEHGADISLHAATKYLVGHSDAMLGVIACRDEAVWKEVRRTSSLLGQCAGPDDLYLAQRGLRTLAVRMERHWRTGVQLAAWLQTRREVRRVLHPALPSDPGHALWKRDFSGASGLFGLELHPTPRPALERMLDGMRLFGMGYSWGGFESLLLPILYDPPRTASPREGQGSGQERGWLLRLHAGLEDVEDLQRDLEAGFDRLALGGDLNP